MISTRWQRLNDLFHDALERPDPDRAGYLAAVCADDPGLASEVAELLAWHERGLWRRRGSPGG